MDQIAKFLLITLPQMGRQSVQYMPDWTQPTVAAMVAVCLGPVGLAFALSGAVLGVFVSLTWRGTRQGMLVLALAPVVLMGGTVLVEALGLFGPYQETVSGLVSLVSIGQAFGLLLGAILAGYVGYALQRLVGVVLAIPANVLRTADRRVSNAE